jgi:2-oxoglutarate dehydrogenase E2 component (dihydrolipoamide succinyltransferase)
LKPEERWFSVVKAAAASEAVAEVTKTIDAAKDSVATPADFLIHDRFFSPLVKHCFSRRCFWMSWNRLMGTGKDGRSY